MSNAHDNFRKAKAPDATLQNLENLANSRDELIRGAIALNCSTPNSILVRLFHDESDHVQECMRQRNKNEH